MDLAALIDLFNHGGSVSEGTPEQRLLEYYSAEAQRVTAEMNCGYRSPKELRDLMSRLIGAPVDDSFRLFPPFYSDFGKNIHLGKNVFINSCCCFQDQGGIYIGDGALIGHRVVIATLNHGLPPNERHSIKPARVSLGKNVWLGAGAIILPGVEIGDNAVVAAGAVVNKSVPAGAVAGGVPAKFIKSV